MHAYTPNSLAVLRTLPLRYLLCSITLITLGVNSPAINAEAQVYDVEVVVFSNQNSGDGGERWPTTVRDDFYTEEFISEGQFTELPASTHRLDGIAYGLNKARGYKVLMHAAWRQPAYDSQHAIVFPVDEVVRNGTSHLAGTIKLIRERFLHLDVDLILSAASAASTVSYGEESTGSPVYELQEKRRIKKSGTLHYFDHPRFGLIATVTPYQSPEQEQAIIDAEEQERAAAAEAVAVEAEPLPEDDQLTR